MNVDVNVLSNRIKAVLESKRERRLRVATWNFSGLCSERKQKEVGEVLAKILLLVRSLGRRRILE